MNARLQWVVVLGLVVGCDAEPQSKPGANAAAPKSVAKAANTAAKPTDDAAKPTQGTAGKPEAKVADTKPIAAKGGTALAPMRFQPSASGDGVLPHAPTQNIEPDLGSPTPHVTTWGWTADGAEFLVCLDDGSDAGSCWAYDTKGSETFSGLGDDPAWTRRVADAGELSKGPTDWTHGEVSITWAAKGKTLHVGATVDGQPGKDKVVELAFPDAEADAMLFLEVVALSPDRSTIAIVGQAAVGESSSLVVRVVSAGSLAAEAYSAAGFAALKAEAFSDAASWFEKATAGSEAWKHPYNLACARSRGELDGVQTALETAIERGGATVRKKASTDDDLKAQRGLEWFVAAVK